MTIINHLVATDLEVTQYLRTSVIRCYVILLDMSVYQNSVCVFLIY